MFSFIQVTHPTIAYPRDLIVKRGRETKSRCTSPIVQIVEALIEDLSLPPISAWVCSFQRLGERCQLSLGVKEYSKNRAINDSSRFSS